jgi:hypothetical protein
VKSWISLILAVIFLTSVVIFNIRQPKTPIKLPPIAPKPSPTVTPIPTLSSTDCQIKDLQGTITFEGAAGSVYGNVKLTNITNKPCEIQLTNTNTLTLTYLPTIKNIEVTNTGSSSAYVYKLYPNSSLYSLIRMQNGPQCQSPLNQVQASLSYPLGNQNVIFTSLGKPYFMINACSNASEMTKVDISPLSPQPGP